jgi:CBS domain-containing protein
MFLSQVLKSKGDLVFTIQPGDTIAAVASLLHTRRVGSMVVVDETHSVIGIVSERDIVRLVAEAGGEGLSRPVSACMTKEVIFADPDETVDVLLERMTDRRIRHLPVCRNGKLVGLISIGDLVKSKIAETVAEAEGLRAYISAA